MSGLMTGYFASYAFNPPSGQMQCWGNATEKVVSPLEDAALGFDTNVTANFHNFFLLIFISYVGQAAISCLNAIAIFFLKPRISSFLDSCTVLN